jgi:hypothetical protein
VRSKWHTLAVVGSLGFFASWNAVADDTSPTTWTDPSAARAAVRSSAAAKPGTGAPESHRIVDELVRQALVELDANRFDTARRLAQRAAAICAATGIVSTRPEQLISEIDRKQQRANVVIPTAARRAEGTPRSERSHKAEAIQLLDHGIMALDQKRFDEAENFARQAAQLPVNWDRFDYRPENLLEDIRRERPAVANAGAARPASDAPFNVHPNAAPSASPVTAWSGQPPAAATPASYQYQTAAPTAPSVAQPPVAPANANAGGRGSAEMLLLQAMDDLRAGNDEMARRRLELAMSSITPSAQSAPVASFGGSGTRPTLPPNGVLVQGSSPPPVYFPVRRDQPSINAPFTAQNDVALKPMHDPYLGDDSATTDKQSAGVQAMRESTPSSAPINHVYLSGNGTSATDNSTVQRVGYESSAPQAPPGYIPPKVQASPEAQALSPQLSWMERMSQPIPPQSAPPPTSYNTAGQADGRPFNPIPTVRPQPSPGDSQLGTAPDQPKPGFFEKVWDSIVGD